MDSIPGLGRCVGEGIDKLLKFSCPENSMERGAWWATVHGAEKSQTQLSMMHCIPTEDKYLLHHFIWIKPGMVIYKEKIGKKKKKGENNILIRTTLFGH